MALNRKYAALPDLDSAPDIYETPELTDDNSTIPTTAARTLSDDEFYDVEDETPGISRSRLRIDEARSRFLPSNVDANGVDFSDRVDGKRKSYRASTRRQRILQDGTEELGDLSDDDDEESLERRLARLRREVEEVKDAYAKRKAEAKQDTSEEPQLVLLSQALDDISKAPLSRVAPTTSKFAAIQRGEEEATESRVDTEATYTVTYAPAYEQSHALAKAADFDRRLLILEKGLGISSSAMSEADGNGLPRALLPSLDAMDKQIMALAQASTANLDAISRRVRALASEQDKLNEAREKAKSLREELGRSAPGAPAEESEQEAKINALYGILPTIENLTPMLPPLLDRLRSLREIHADAANASDTLSRIEKQQADMTTELKQWNDGLEKIEAAMQEGDVTMKNNMTIMDNWVKDLEQRIEDL